MERLKIGNLKIKIPIIQGGMGVGISLSGLASAVANEGGVGVISSAGIGLINKNYDKDYLRGNINALKKEIQQARKLTNGVLGVNIMVAMTNFADIVKTSIAEGIDIVFSGAGLPLNMPQYLFEGAKTKLVPIVSSARAANIICAKWSGIYNYLPDAIVVEGPKAGGHLGFKRNQIFNSDYSLEKLVAEVKSSLKSFEEKYKKSIPVIAAGGIYNGSDIQKFLKLGASGVQLGTRFVTTNECDASDKFKQAYINAKEEDIKIIKSPIGLPGRALGSKFIEKVEAGQKRPYKCPFHCISTCDIENSPYCIVAALINALKGNFNNGFAFAGTNAFRATKIISVKETIKNILQEYREAIK
jgi:NAD(P)H-dependent flavin oxidoreductase YrpB (nitropropane dioxygenase family)